MTSHYCITAYHFILYGIVQMVKEAWLTWMKVTLSWLKVNIVLLMNIFRLLQWWKKKIKTTKTLLSSDLIDIYQFERLKPHQHLSFTVLSLNLDQVALLHPILLRLMSDQQSFMGRLCCLVGLCRLCEPVAVFAHVCLFRFPFGDGLGLVVRCCSYLPPQ